MVDGMVGSEREADRGSCGRADGRERREMEVSRVYPRRPS